MNTSAHSLGVCGPLLNVALIFAAHNSNRCNCGLTWNKRNLDHFRKKVTFHLTWLVVSDSRMRATDASSKLMGSSIKFAKRKQVGDGRIGVIDVTAVWSNSTVYWVLTPSRLQTDFACVTSRITVYFRILEITYMKLNVMLLKWHNKDPSSDGT